MLAVKVFGFWPQVGDKPARIFADDVEVEWQGGKYSTAMTAALHHVEQGAVVHTVHIGETIVSLRHITWDAIIGGRQHGHH